MIHIEAKSPTRIDLAGGTLDLWPIHHMLKSKATVNVAVAIYSTVEIKSSDDSQYHLHSLDQSISMSGSFEEVVANQKLPLLGLLLSAFWGPSLPPLSIKIKAESPKGAGLGGSSSLAVTLAGALNYLQSHLTQEPGLSGRGLIHMVRDVEAALIKAPTGIQDYWAAFRGGVNIITYPYGGESVQSIDPDFAKGLEESLIVCYSGESRASAINNWEIFKRVFDQDAQLLSNLESIGQCALNCADAVSQNQLSDILKWSEKEWEIRRQIWPNIETEKTKAIDKAAINSGATFTRICGAGGGGVIAIFVPPEHKQQVEQALSPLGVLLSSNLALDGLTINEL